MVGDFLRKVTAALEMSGIAYMLTGSVASSMYGTPRSTNDIDIVIESTPAQMMMFAQLMKRFDLYLNEDAVDALRSRSQVNVIDFRNSWKVDLIIRKEREFSRNEFERRATHEVAGVRLTIATPEDVVLAKLEWSKMSGTSDTQLNDAAGILRAQGSRLDRSYVEHWVQVLEVHDQWEEVLRRALI